MKRFAAILLVTAVLISLAGCGGTLPATEASAEPTEATRLSTARPEETTEPPVPEDTVYSFEEIDYYLTIPGTWEGRCNVEQDGQSVRVSTDGAVNFTLLAVPNDEQAQQHENEVQEAGYQFFREGFAWTYYLQIENPFPEDLTWNFRGVGDMTDVTVWDAWMLFSPVSDTKDGHAWWISFLELIGLHPAGDSFCNNRLGLRLDLPEEWRGSYIITMHRDRLALAPTQGALDEANVDITPIFQITRIRSDTQASEVEYAMTEGTLVAKTDDAEYYLMPPPDQKPGLYNEAWLDYEEVFRTVVSFTDEDAVLYY